jgi:alpha-amylase
LNLQATLARRPEAYHRKVLAGANGDNGNGDVASIHDRVVFKQENLDQHVRYDQHERNSLIDHFYDENVTLDDVVHGRAIERGDFAQSPFETRLRRNPDQIQVVMNRQGNMWGLPVQITKGVSLRAGDSALELAYLLEGLPQDRAHRFAVELNFAGLPAGADDRFFYQGDAEQRLGHLGTSLDLHDVAQLGMIDQWLGIDVSLTASQPAGVWAYPIETVSQSEGGFELVHQSVVVQPHWLVRGDALGRWSVTMRLALDTTLAESRCVSVESANVT